MEEFLLEIDHFQLKVIIKKAYEWLDKINKRNNRVAYFRTLAFLKKHKKKLNKDISISLNQNELSLAVSWFTKYPPKNKNENMVFGSLGLIYKML